MCDSPLVHAGVALRDGQGHRAVPANRVQVLSTGGMLDAARRTRAEQVLVATEIGMLHQLRTTAPGVEFLPVNPEAACRYMKLTTAVALLRSLRTGEAQVEVPTAVAEHARTALEAMVAIGSPGPGE